RHPVQAVAFIAWRGKHYVTPFDHLERALAFIANSDRIGIDYEYAAVFDTSEFGHPRIVSERFTGGLAAVGADGAPAAPEASAAEERLERLDGLVSIHDLLWRNLAWRSDPETMSRAKIWLIHHWEPWYEWWRSHLLLGVPRDRDGRIL